MNYTKGEWKVEKWGHGISIWQHHGIDTDTNQIAHLPLGHGIPDETVEANAQLISAAPDMYEALKLILSLGLNEGRRDIANKAIAKAEGK